MSNEDSHKCTRQISNCKDEKASDLISLDERPFLMEEGQGVPLKHRRCPG